MEIRGGGWGGRKREEIKEPFNQDSMICEHWFPFGSIMRALSERTGQRSDLKCPDFITLGPARLSLPRTGRTGQAQNCNTVAPYGRVLSPSGLRFIFSTVSHFWRPLPSASPRYTSWRNGCRGMHWGFRGREEKLSPSGILAKCPHLPSQADVWLLELLISYQQYPSFPYLSKTWLSKLQAQWKTQHRDGWKIQFLPPKELQVKGEIRRVRSSRQHQNTMMWVLQGLRREQLAMCRELGLTGQCLGWVWNDRG